MLELLIALLVVILAFSLIWCAICLMRLPSPGGLVAHVILCIAMVMVLVGYVLPIVHMPRVNDSTIRTASFVR